VFANAQIEIAKFLGKNSSEYKMGFRSFLKFAYPVSETADINGRRVSFPIRRRHTI